MSSRNHREVRYTYIAFHTRLCKVGNATIGLQITSVLVHSKAESSEVESATNASKRVGIVLQS